MNLRLLLLSALLGAGLLSGQTDGVIEGVVEDPSGAVLENARLTLEQQETGLERRLETDARGRYRALRLPPGPYRVHAESEGFQAQVREGIDLSAGEVAQVDFRLALGEQREELVVQGEAPLVSVDASDWGGLVEPEKLEDMPLNGRDLFELSALEPGATLPPSARSSLAQGLGLQISVNGSRPNQNSFQIDGVFVNDATSSLPASAAGNLLGLETVREINLVTNPFSAEYGRTAGGMFTAVSRSGGNQFHGALYEYFRNNALDAKNFFDSPGEPIPPLRRNQFGGVVSGPIVRNRAFFLANYEGLRQRRNATLRATTPTAEARQGLLPAPGGGVREVPIDATVRPYLDLFPLPNGRLFGDGTGEYINQASSSVDEDYFAGKFDWQIDSARRVSTRYTFSDALSADPEPMGVWNFLLASRDHFFQSELQTVHSPRAISTIRAAFSRVNNSETSDTLIDVPAELSFVEGQPLGTIQVTGLSEFGGFQARARPRTFIINSFQLNGDLLRSFGRHTLRIGGGFDRVQFNQESDLSAVGSYTFNSLVDFYAGDASFAEVMHPSSDTVRHWRHNQFLGYIQDDMRLGESLSLSLGVRYEAASTPTETDGKIAVLRDPLHDTSTTLGGPVYDNPSWTNFAPRAALAWDPYGAGKTVIRVGGGLFYDLLGSRELVIAGVRTPPLFNRILVFGQPAFPDILGAAEGRNPSSAIDGLDFDLEQPYVARWQFNIERRLSDDAALRIGYAGLRGIHLMGQLGNFNTPVPQYTEEGRVFFPADAPLLNPAFSRIGLRRSQFNSFYHGLTIGLDSRWRSRFRYQAKYTWSKSIDEASSQTFNDFVASDQVPTTHDYRQNRGLSDFDMRHVFAGSFSYFVPDVVEQGPARWLLNGWELHGLSQLQSGNPFAPSIGFDRANLQIGFGDAGQRPDLLVPPGTEIVQGGPDQYFNPQAFGLPPAGFLGTLGRGTLIGPSLFTLDLAAHKQLWATERQRVLLRAEFFNSTNRPNFQIPSELQLFTSEGGRIGSAGRITETTTGSRQVQLALRWEF